MSLDKLVDFMIEAAKKEYQAEPNPVSLGLFYIEVKARQLVKPSKDLAKHHRQREKHYTKMLEAAEKELRQKGVAVDVVDQFGSVMAAYGIIGSGAIGSGSLSGGAKFQPKINQDMLDKVQRAKAKMVEHRDSACQYEKYARAFACAPDKVVKLSVGEVDYFKLEGKQ